MRKEVYPIKSKILEKDIKVCVYGHYGISVLLFPIHNDNPLEYENIGLIQELAPLIERGFIKFISFESFNKGCWSNKEIEPKVRSDNHYKFNLFLTSELVPFIYNDNGAAVPIVTSGVGIGAFHAVNSYLRRPDIFLGSIGVNGFYDIQWLSGAYYDENCYFNSPVHYLPNLTDDYWLSFLKSQHHLHLIAQDGNWDMIGQSTKLAEILKRKEIPHKYEVQNIYQDSQVDFYKSMLLNIFKFNF
ncbi:MAG: hypothetical protein A2X64_01475 [Ignavibacteria bacterium GWF2_33_9]|nr:MAG: hypothetical protein A2X64_01475 [Ignavibacteria bacterium GWF2_33_9]